MDWIWMQSFGTSIEGKHSSLTSSFGTQAPNDQPVMGSDTTFDLGQWSQTWPGAQDNIYGFLGLGGNDYDGSNSHHDST